MNGKVLVVVLGEILMAVQGEVLVVVVGEILMAVRGEVLEVVLGEILAAVGGKVLAGEYVDMLLGSLFAGVKDFKIIFNFAAAQKLHYCIKL